MIFWRVLDNQLYNVGEVNRLGFEESEGLRIPDEYLDKLQFMVMRGAQGLGDWGIIYAMPRLLKQKYPTCKVYIPSSFFLSNLFNQPNESTWQNPYENVYNVFKDNPYIDGFKDFMLGEVFHDHYRIYDKNKKDGFYIINNLETINLDKKNNFTLDFDDVIQHGHRFFQFDLFVYQIKIRLG